jgi:hypothetical protein
VTFQRDLNVIEMEKIIGLVNGDLLMEAKKTLFEIWQIEWKKRLANEV